MIIPSIFVGKTATVLAIVTGLFAVTEAFVGQLLVSLIAAIPTTGMMIIAFISLKRGQAEQKKNQAEMAVALDGKLTKLMEAEKGVSKAEGVAEERDRVTPTPPIVKVEIVKDSPK